MYMIYRMELLEKIRNRVYPANPVYPCRLPIPIRDVAVFGNRYTRRTDSGIETRRNVASKADRDETQCRVESG